MLEIFNRLSEKDSRRYAGVEALKELIERTITKKGLSVAACILNKAYETKMKVVAGFKHMRILFDKQLGIWNYDATPKKETLEVA